MKVLSLFSGVGGFDIGLERAGMQVVAQCEIDPFCQRVLAHHWPEVSRYGDVRDIGLGPCERDQQGQQDDHEARQPDVARIRYVGRLSTDGLHEPAVGRDASHRAEGGRSQLPGHIDLICGGFPCQDLSVAGKRAGLDGERSGLWFEFQRILQELRPSWALIENVPGLLSSNSGRDFAVILDGLGECGFSGIAWAVLDSQHFGVPQRRRRVYVVAGPSRRSVEQVLSLCESCGGHPQTGRTAGQDIAATIRGRSSNPGVNEPGRGGEDDSNLIVAAPLPGHHPRHDLDNDTYAIQERAVAENPDVGPGGKGWQANIAYTLEARHHVQAVAHSLRAAVRRLTPTECERLQGFPDGWTDVGGAADGPRYKALGNAVTMSVIEYIGRRIMAVQSR